MNKETVVKAIRGIDSNLINEAAAQVADLAEKARWMIEEVATRGLVVTPTIFGMRIPIEIQLGPDKES